MLKVVIYIWMLVLAPHVAAQEISPELQNRVEQAYVTQDYDLASNLLADIPELLGVIPLLDQPKDEERAKIFFDLARIRLAQKDTAKANTILAYVFALDPNANSGIMNVGNDAPLEKTRAQLSLMRQTQRQSELSATTFWGAAGRSLVLPGWGHFYKGRKKRAYTFMGATALAAIYWYAADRSYKRAYDSYRSTQIGELNLDQRVGAGTDPNPFQQRFENAESKANKANVALGILAGIWLAGVFDHAFVGPAQLSVGFPIF